MGGGMFGEDLIAIPTFAKRILTMSGAKFLAELTDVRDADEPGTGPLSVMRVRRFSCVTHVVVKGTSLRSVTQGHMCSIPKSLTLKSLARIRRATKKSCVVEATIRQCLDSPPKNVQARLLSV